MRLRWPWVALSVAFVAVAEGQHLRRNVTSRTVTLTETGAFISIASSLPVAGSALDSTARDEAVLYEDAIRNGIPVADRTVVLQLHGAVFDVDAAMALYGPGDAVEYFVSCIGFDTTFAPRVASALFALWTRNAVAVRSTTAVLSFESYASFSSGGSRTPLSPPPTTARPSSNATKSVPVVSAGGAPRNNCRQGALEWFQITVSKKCLRAARHSDSLRSPKVWVCAGSRQAPAQLPTSSNYGSLAATSDAAWAVTVTSLTLSMAVGGASPLGPMLLARSLPLLSIASCGVEGVVLLREEERQRLRDAIPNAEALPRSWLRLVVFRSVFSDAFYAAEDGIGSNDRFRLSAAVASATTVDVTAEGISWPVFRLSSIFVGVALVMLFVAAAATVVCGRESDPYNGGDVPSELQSPSAGFFSMTRCITFAKSLALCSYPSRLTHLYVVVLTVSLPVTMAALAVLTPSWVPVAAAVSCYLPAGAFTVLWLRSAVTQAASRATVIAQRGCPSWTATLAHTPAERRRALWSLWKRTLFFRDEQAVARRVELDVADESFVGRECVLTWLATAHNRYQWGTYAGSAIKDADRFWVERHTSFFTGCRKGCRHGLLVPLFVGIILAALDGSMVSSSLFSTVNSPTLAFLPKFVADSNTFSCGLVRWLAVTLSGLEAIWIAAKRPFNAPSSNAAAIVGSTLFTLAQIVAAAVPFVPNVSQDRIDETTPIDLSESLMQTATNCLIAAVGIIFVLETLWTVVGSVIFTSIDVICVGMARRQVRRAKVGSSAIVTHQEPTPRNPLDVMVAPRRASPQKATAAHPDPFAIAPILLLQAQDGREDTGCQRFATVMRIVACQAILFLHVRDVTVPGKRQRVVDVDSAEPEPVLATPSPPPPHVDADDLLIRLL